MNQLLLAGALTFAVLISGGNAWAQDDQGNNAQRGRRQRQGNMDPAQFQQRMMDRYRERLEIKDDAEWKAIEPLVQKVAEARMAMGGGRGGAGRGTRPGGDGSATNSAPSRAPVRSNAAAEELQKAIDAKASSPELKTALAKYLEYRKSKQADLDKAQSALRAVLTSRQEAIATLSGLL